MTTHKNCSGISFFLILLIGIVISISLLTILMVSTQLSIFNTPSQKTIHRYIDKRKFDKAYYLVEKLPQNDPGVMFLKAKIHFFKALDNREKRHWLQYGEDTDDWFKDENLDRAIGYCKNVIEYNEQFCHDAHLLLGIIYKEKGWYQLAEEQLKLSIEKNDTSINSRLAIASLYVATGKYSDAALQLHAAYQTNNRDPLVAKNMAFLYKYYIEKPESALVWFNRFLKYAHKRDLDINLAKNQCKEISGRYPEYVSEETRNWMEAKPKFTPRK